MLVLTRKLQQQIRIGEDIVVTIVQVKGRTVRVGIEAPESVRVVRAELPLHEAGAASAAGKPAASAKPRLTDRAPRVDSTAGFSSPRGQEGPQVLLDEPARMALPRLAVRDAAVAPSVVRSPARLTASGLRGFVAARRQGG